MTKAERDSIFYENEKLIWHVLYKYFPMESRRYDDLYQVAALAMLNCIPRFDKKKGNLSTYLVKCMCGRIQRYIAKDTTLHIPVHKFKTEKGNKNVMYVLGFDCNINNDGFSVAEFYPDDSGEYEEVEFLTAVMQEVSQRDYDMLVDRLRGYTVPELAQKYGMKEGSVRTTIARVRKKIKDNAL